MSNVKDFVMENGILTKYTGSDEDVVLPDSVTAIGKRAFSGCSSLTSIVIPDSVTAIGEHAFCDCSSLTSIVIPDSVTAIGDWVFYGCSSLTSIVIPDSVTAIGERAFAFCSIRKKRAASLYLPHGSAVQQNPGSHALCG